MLESISKNKAALTLAQQDSELEIPITSWATGFRNKLRIVAMNLKGFSSLYIGVNLAILMGLSCLSKSVELKVKNDSREHDDFQDNASLQRNIFTCLITQINCV